MPQQRQRLRLRVRALDGERDGHTTGVGFKALHLHIGAGEELLQGLSVAHLLARIRGQVIDARVADELAQQINRGLFSQPLPP